MFYILKDFHWIVLSIEHFSHQLPEIKAKLHMTSRN